MEPSAAYYSSMKLNRVRTARIETEQQIKNKPSAHNLTRQSSKSFSHLDELCLKEKNANVINILNNNNHNNCNNNKTAANSFSYNLQPSRKSKENDEELDLNNNANAGHRSLGSSYLKAIIFKHHKSAVTTVPVSKTTSLTTTGNGEGGGTRKLSASALFGFNNLRQHLNNSKPF